jgi:hypothetical protein
MLKLAKITTLLAMGALATGCGSPVPDRASTQRSLATPLITLFECRSNPLRACEHSDEPSQRLHRQRQRDRPGVRSRRQPTAGHRTAACLVSTATLRRARRLQSYEQL